MAEFGTQATGKLVTGAILVVISFVIALTVLPTLTASIKTAKNDGNLSSAAAAMLDVIPIVIVAGLVLAGVGFLVSGVRDIKG